MLSLKHFIVLLLKRLLQIVSEVNSKQNKRKKTKFGVIIENCLAVISSVVGVACAMIAIFPAVLNLVILAVIYL